MKVTLPGEKRLVWCGQPINTRRERPEILRLLLRFSGPRQRPRVVENQIIIMIDGRQNII